MNILIIGSGGREHALAKAYGKNKKVKKVVVVPGNGLISLANDKILSESSVNALDFDGILKLIKKHKISLVDVAQDEPLAQGFVNRLQELGIKAFGPTKEASEIEWNKEWSRNFMKKYKLSSPNFTAFTNTAKAISYIKSAKQDSFFVKASGLALGKGAIRADSKEDAINAVSEMKQFGKAGEVFLIEEKITGEEFSVFAVCDGVNYKILGYAQDHKTLYNQDKGPNTGGMGCVSNPKIITEKILKEIEKNILLPFIKGMAREKRSYTGIIYLGGMATAKGIKIIEFNSRWGDPEAEVLIPSIKADYLTIVEASLTKKLKNLKVKRDNLSRISVAGCSQGYPKDYSDVRGKEIFGLQKIMNIPGITVFGAGVRKDKNKFFVNGGRIFHVVAESQTIQKAREKVYGAISNCYVAGNNLYYRTDIGWRDLERKN